VVAEGDNAPSGRFSDCLGDASPQADAGPAESPGGKQMPSLRGRAPREETDKETLKLHGSVMAIEIAKEGALCGGEMGAFC
jgi:hypothetical protein